VFEVGRIYNRRQEIHEPYWGQWQSGISTPADRPFIFLFSGESGNMQDSVVSAMEEAFS
jgi:5-methylcytosine-specific restriction enzyme A